MSVAQNAAAASASSLAASSSATPAVTASSTSGTAKQPQSFEFTKRKRWADLLVSELADAISLILSPTCTILFCGQAVNELLGWSAEELLDFDLLDLISLDDQSTFRNSFETSLRTGNDLLAYVRMKYKTPYGSGERPQELLFEIKGYPHFVPSMDQSQSQCFFAAAKPYPSRNMTMLNTFMEVKIENERLQQRLAELRAQQPSSLPFHYPPSPPPLSTSGVKPGSEMDLFYNASYPGLSTNLASVDDYNIPSHSKGGIDGSKLSTGSYPIPASVNPEEDQPEENTSKKRKLSRAYGAASQHVCFTCGRTDSPEWRKGPQGPKTLCNACGLRWAKQMRTKPEEESGSRNNTSTGGDAAAD